MSGKPVGISNMNLYVPQALMSLESILEHRAAEQPELERRLRRAIESTDQVSIRFTRPWEDPVTLAAQAARPLLVDSEATGSVRYFAVGTETSVDMSKPIASYAHGVLQRSGVALPRELSTFQVQHACAGGTIALMSVSAMLAATGRPGESGMVVCSDVARYQTPSTAEITQGAGAVAMTVEENPRLVTLDLDTVGLASADVDDFFRPLGSVTARVKGRYSVDCYNDALDAAFLDHCSRRALTPAEVLAATDMFVVHVPFHRMAVTGMTKLLEHHLPAEPAEAATFLEEHHFGEGIEAARHVGNIYSGSAWMSLMFSLANRYAKVGSDIVGQRVLIASYGSGNTMTVLSATVAADAPAVLDTWDLKGILDGAAPATFEEYEAFVEKESYDLTFGATGGEAAAHPGTYYLAEIREDGFRRYEFATP